MPEIKNIFVLQGFLLTAVSMAIGLLISTGIVAIQQEFKLFMITSSIPYPVELRLSNLVIVITTITVLGFLAAKVASSRISNNFIKK